MVLSRKKSHEKLREDFTKATHKTPSATSTKAPGPKHRYHYRDPLKPSKQTPAASRNKTKITMLKFQARMWTQRMAVSPSSSPNQQTEQVLPELTTPRARR